MNAKAEFLRLVEDAIRSTKCFNLVCAEIGPNEYGKEGWIYLKRDHSDADLERFLEALDYEYDDGFGRQELHGTVWFDQGAWAVRGEYDGSEWWVINSYPPIPAHLEDELL